MAKKPNTEDAGEGSGMSGLDSADPHPAEEGNPYGARHPGGANPPKPATDIGPNPAAHDGTNRPKPAHPRRKNAT